MIPAIQEVNFPPYATLHQATVSLQDMGDRVISTQVRIDGDVVPDFSGWELKFKGERFVLPSDNPQASKDNTTRNSIVDLQFQSWVIQELKRYYFFEAASVSAGVAIADKYVTPVRLNVEDFVAMLNQVLKYYFGDTVVADLYMSGQGQYSTEPKVIDINYSYLWDVIGQIYEIYGVRYRIVYNSTTGVYTIKFGWPTTDIDITDHDFEYGYKGGLLKFERQVQDETITNILLGRGGEKNLPYRYFKKVDPQNPTWAADPDAIPELKNIYFDRLRDINFRWYVRGWMHNPNRDTSGDEAWDPGHVFPTYEISSDSPYYWSYQKGLTDTQFNPVEFVKDDASIEAYGERWGAADDNDEIYPTIQGRSRNPIGRIDEVVAVSPIVTDDIDAMAAASSVEKSIDRMVVTSPSSNPYTIDSDWFEIPTGQTGNIRYAWVGPTDGSSVTHIATDQSSIVAIDANGTEHPISGLSAGRYKLHLSLKLYVPSGYTTAGQWGLENIVLTTSAQDANAWKPTFDIWVKNIWGTTKGSGESAEQYAARVWEEILGDRAGNEAKVVFSTGFMSVSEDYEFVIASYPVYDTSKNINGVPSEWRITLRKSDAEYEATGLYIPNATTGGKPVAGDKFFFTGIDMPFLYVTLGEEDLNTNKSSQLEGLSVVNPTWVISLDKVRVHTLEDGEYGQTLADRLAAGAKLRITDPRFSGGDILTLYAQSITYTWNEPSENSPYIVPDIEVVLSDKVVSRQSRADKIESSIQEIRSNYARLDDVERVVRSVAEPMFLKKTGEADSSDSPTQFSSKVSSKGFRQGGVGGNGWGFYRDNTKEVAEGEEGEGDSVLEIDRIVVRKELEVNSLVVNQAEYRGGREIQSAAQIECTKVVVDDSGKYVCYFDQKQGSVKNLFVVGDFAYSTEFAPDNTVVKYYRRRVDAVDVDRIVLSDTVKDGAGVPAAGDVIIQYGHESNTARQYVIVRDVIGGGYERMISGLSTVSTNGEEYYFAGRQTGQYYDKPRWFVGDSDGEYAEYLNGILNIKGRLQVLGESGSYSDLGYLADALPKKGSTLIQGGLILTSMIQLGQVENSTFKVYSGINGKIDTSLEDPLETIAAWYGGPMVDHEASPSEANYAKSLFRMNGSGYLAGGNIYWDENGYGGIPGITWSRPSGSQNDVITIGADVMLESTGGADSSVTDLITLVRSLSNMFEDESYTEGGQTKHRIKVKSGFEGLYTNGYLSAGGVSSGGGQAAGNASLSNVTTLAHGQTGELSASGVGNLVLYDKDAVDYMIANAGQVKKVAGISPNSAGDIPVESLSAALDLAAASHRAVASSVGAGVTGLVPGSLLQSVLGDGTWDSTNTVKQFVNSSIQTATAIYRGSYNLVTDLSLTTSATQAQIGAALASAISGEDNNDYAFVQIPTSDATPTEIARTDRYKFNGTSWVFEYSLNNSGYTAAQWAAINSGITAGKVTGYDTIAGYFTNGIISTSNLPSLYIGTTAVQYTSQQQDLAGIGAFTMANSKHLSILDANGTARSALFMTTANDLYVGRGMPEMSTPGKTYIYGGAVILATGANRTTAVTVSASQAVTLAKAAYFNNGYGIFMKDNPSEGTATSRETFALTSDNILRIGYGIRGTGYTGRIYGGRAYNIYLDDTSNSNAARYVINYACIRPAATSAYDLGAATITWRNAYIDTIYEGGTSLANKYHPKGGDNALAFVASTVSASTSVTAPKFYLDANTYFELDSDGYVHLVTPTGKGFYADGFISAGGLSTGGGSTGIDEAAMWVALQRNSGEGLNKQIHNKHLPTCGTGLSYTLNSDGIATAINVAFPVTSVAGKTGAVTLAVADITDFPTTWAWANITGAPSTMPNPAALTFGTKTYDGSAAKTILASDLGALTSHQTVTLASGTNNYTMKLTTAAGSTDNVPVTGLAAAVDTLQAQIDSVSSRDMFDELYASAFFSDIVAASDIYGYLHGTAESAERLTTVSKTAWGQTYWTSGGVPDSISGNMSSVGSISMSGSISGATTIAASTSVTTPKLYLDSDNYFEIVDGKVHLHVGTNGGFYTEGFVSAGGLSNGSGSAGVNMAAVWASLTNQSSDHTYDSTLIDGAHIPDMASTYGYIKGVSLAAGASNGTLHLVVDGVAASDVAVTGLADAAYRGVASSVGLSVTGLVPGSLLYGVLGDSFDTTNTVKAFVNSSIATATATFRGTNTTATTESAFLTWANALTKTLNDYVFWRTTDSAGNVVFKRYKYGYDGTEAGALAWRYEYDLNNSSFTAAQWSAINSGITATKVGNYDTIAGYFSNGLLSASHVGDLSGTYLPLRGGTLSGNLTINHAASGGAMLIYKNERAISSGGGWNDHVISIADSSGTELGRLGIYGAGADLNYFHLGLNAYNGNNLRVYADKVQFGGSTIYHSGNSNLTTVDWKARNLILPNGSAIYMADNPSEGSATNRAVLAFATGNVLRIGYGIRTTEYHTQIYGGNRIRFATAISGATADRFLMLGNDFYPNATEVSDLGIASRYWNNAYIKTIYENGTSLAEKYHPKGGDSSLNFAAAAIEATSFKLASGTPTLTWDGTNSAWHLSGNFYADGWVSAGGVSNGGGSTGIDEAAMRVALGRNSGDGLGKQIHSAHLPTLSAAGGLTASYSGLPDSVSLSIGIDSSHYLPTTTDQSNWNAKVAPADLGVQIIELTDSGSTTAGTWVASSSKITALTDGMMVRYKITVAGASNTYLNVNGLGAKRVYRYGSTKLTTHYSVGEYVTLYYCANLNSGCWECVDGYDATVNNVRQYITSSNVEYPLLFRYNTGSTETYVTEYTRFASAVTLNPSTGTITANAFKVTNGTSGGFLKANGSVDTNTYLTGNQSITLSGDVSGNGTTSISVTIGAKKVAKSMLAQGVQDSLDKADTALQSFTETDPTVPSWAKASSKPSYNLDEVSDGSTRKLSNYLPLSGGTMTGQLQIATGYGIEDATGNGMLCYHPSSWTGVSSSQWGVGAVDCQGVIRSSNSNLIHSRAGSDSTIYDSGNSNNSSTAWTCSYLTVNANAQTSYRAYVNGVIASTGDQIITSDETKKMNLEDIQLSVRDIASVRAVTYDLKADGSHSFGTIAQDWLRILPEAVLGEEGDYSFAYAQAAMVSSIINSREIVKIEKHETEQDKEIRELKAALGKANGRIADLEAEVSRLRAN